MEHETAESYDAAYQGAPGAFSEEAALAILGGGARLLPCRRFEEVFDAVRGGRSRFGVVPIENTLAGSVVATYDLLAGRELAIVGETVRHIRHALIAAPGATPDGLRRVHSHPVALAQCEGFFRRNPGIEAVAVYDTAGAVEQVVSAGDPSHGAIAGRRAADVYGGVVLEDGIQDDEENYTRFLVIARPGDEPPGLGGEAAGDKTSLVVTISNAPGRLYECLRHFAERGIDLSKIESRPLRGRPFEYAFYIDLLGRAGDAAVAEALAALGPSALSVRVLGSYPRRVTEPPQPRGA